MAKINIYKKTVKELFENKNLDFLITDWQRPYTWDKEECLALWDDIFTFTFPDNDYSKFDFNNDELFLDLLITFKNEKGKTEINDGQQIISTIMLLLRAFYEKLVNMEDDNSKKTREIIEKCIWKTDEFGKLDKNILKINSDETIDDDKDELFKILISGIVTNEQKSNYAINYSFFQKQIDNFIDKYPGYFSYLPTRILNNCIILHIEAESLNTALRIISRLNDRGKSLFDTDIFKE